MKDIQREIEEKSIEKRKLLPPFEEILEMQSELATVSRELRESKGISLSKMVDLILRLLKLDVINSPQPDQTKRLIVFRFPDMFEV